MSAARPCSGLSLRLLVLAAAATPGLALAYTCSVSATTVAFGIYSPTAGSPNVTTGTITVTCSPNVVSLPVNYTVALSTGGSGTYSPRRMSAGAATLAYQLYTDAAYSIVWGDGTAGTSLVNGSLTLGLINPVTASYTVYGRIAAGLTGTAPGSYSDTITVTLTY